MKIGVIGCGNVGNALIAALKRAHEIVAWDKFKKSPNKLQDFKECECIFIAVPTPILKSGSIDKSAIYDSIETLLSAHVKEGILILKSTAVSGTTDELASKYPMFEFAFNPEFLREKTANEDMLNMNRIIIGAEEKMVHELVKRIYLEAGYSEDKCAYIFTNRKTSELIKYASNSYLASKIVYANELYKICQALGVDYETVVDAICLDKRISREYGWKVPGEDGKFSFSGRCFPKDLSAFIYLAKENGYTPNFLMEVWRSNLDFRGEQDWLKISGVYDDKNKEF